MHATNNEELLILRGGHNSEVRSSFGLTLLYSEQPKLNRVLAVLSAIGLNMFIWIFSQTMFALQHANFRFGMEAYCLLSSSGFVYPKVFKYWDT